MTDASRGALYIVDHRPYVDSRALHNLTRTHTVTPIDGGWRVQGSDGLAVLCLKTSLPPLPEQHGVLYEARADRGTALTDACASWIARGAARIAGKYAHWPSASTCGCGATCVCGPCQRRHAHGATASMDSPDPSQPDSSTRAALRAEDEAVGGVSDRDAAQFVLDFLTQKLPESYASVEMMQPWGFRLTLYQRESDRLTQVMTVEVQDRDILETHWDKPLDDATMDRLRDAVDSAIHLAFTPAKPTREHKHERITDDEAAKYVLDRLVFEVGDYMPEAERRKPSGFFLHLYLTGEGQDRRVATFEVLGRNSLRAVWLRDATSPRLRSKIIQAIDRLVQEAYDEENHHDPG